VTRHLRKMKAARQVEAVEQQGHVEETVLAELNDPAAPEGADG